MGGDEGGLGPGGVVGGGERGDCQQGKDGWIQVLGFDRVSVANFQFSSTLGLGTTRRGGRMDARSDRRVETLIGVLTALLLDTMSG